MNEINVYVYMNIFNFKIIIPSCLLSIINIHYFIHIYVLVRMNNRSIFQHIAINPHFQRTVLLNRLAFCRRIALVSGATTSAIHELGQVGRKWLVSTRFRAIYSCCCERSSPDKTYFVYDPLIRMSTKVTFIIHLI